MKRLAILAAALSLTAAHAYAADPAEGDWLVQSGDAKVHIAPCGRAQLCGNIFWLKVPRDEEGQPKHDEHNPEASLRHRPVLGLQMIWGFHGEGAGRWEGGKIYDPKSGKTYASKMRIAGDGALKVSGCIAIFCQAQTWTRVN